MYSSEKNPGIAWKDIIVKVLFFVIFILLIIWLFPKTPNMDPFYSNVFRENIKYMQEAAKSYYTNERLPQNVGDVAEMTLQDMINKNLIVPFVDKDGKLCDTKASYVQVTKEETEYSLKVNLVCDDEQSYIIETLGCYDRCEDGSCQPKEDDKKTAIEYQFRQSYTTNKTTYSCPSGYTLNGTTCYKEVTGDKINATPKYNTKDIVVDALLNKGEDKKQYIDPIVDIQTINSCPSGYIKNGNTCYTATFATAVNNGVGYTCPSGYTLNGNLCNKISTINATAVNNGVSYTCPSGYTKNGTTCTRTTTINATQTSNGVSYSCPSGYTRNGSTCTKTTTTNATSKTTREYLYDTYYVAPAGYTCSSSPVYICESSYNCPGATEIYGSCYKDVTSYTCPSGYTKNGTTCTKTETTSATQTSNGVSYSCPSGYTRSGSTCTKTETINATETNNGISYTCPNGYALSAGVCYKTDTINATQVSNGNSYTCPQGYLISGTTCYKYAKIETTTNKIYGCPVGYTKSGSGANTTCYQITKGNSSYYCKNAGYTLIGKKCYGTDKTLEGYTCPKDYTLDGKVCFKKGTESIKATETTKKVTGYNYKWSKSENLSGWEKTGKTRTVEI